jgi:hypothetical protein
MNTINVQVGDDVEVLVQIYPNETFEYEGRVVSIGSDMLTLSTTDSPHKHYASEREVDILLTMIRNVEVLSR